MNGGSGSDDQARGSQPGESGWANVPPWERAGGQQQPGPPEPAYGATQHDADGTTDQEPAQAAETMYGLGPHGGDPRGRPDPDAQEPQAPPPLGAVGGPYGGGPGDPYGGGGPGDPYSGGPGSPYGSGGPADPYGSGPGDPYGGPTGDPYGQGYGFPPGGAAPGGYGDLGAPQGPHHGPVPPPGTGPQPGPGPQGPPPGAGPPPGSPGSGGGGGGSKAPLIVALVVIGVLVLGGMTAGGVAIVRAGSDPSPTPSPTPSTTTSSPAPTLDTPTPAETTAVPLPQRLNERSADPERLTLGELFPKTYSAENDNKYRRHATKMFKKCGPAATGGKLERALKKGKCTQVAAATYVNKKDNAVITIGLANLVDLAASERVKKAVRPSANIVFEPLNGKSPASFRGKSFFQFSSPVGHYNEWAAATYTHKSPTKTGSNQKLFTAWADMQDMLDKPLSLRMIKATP